MPRDVVVLVPGFLGFKRFGNFDYFERRVVEKLEQLTGCAVVATSTVPTGPLAGRQQQLIGELARLLETGVGGGADGGSSEVRLHLVGHSTGGVDAQLLTTTRPLAPRTRWSAHDARVRGAIRTVIAIGSPHHGTCLATSRLARAFSGWSGLSLSSLSSLARAALALGPSILWDGMVWRLLAGALADPVSVGRYVADVLGRGELIDELRPESMNRIRAAYPRDRALDVRFRSVVTMAGQRTRGYRDPGTGDTGDRCPDAFFEELYRHTAGAEAPCGARAPAVTRIVERLRSIPPRDWIMNPRAIPRPVDAALNDGVVNACRQVVDPGDLDELLAVVVADHIDVLGYYPHLARDHGARAELEKNGILHSGSGFTDDTFDALYRRVAGAIQL